MENVGRSMFALSCNDEWINVVRLTFLHIKQNQFCVNQTPNEADQQIDGYSHSESRFLLQIAVVYVVRC